MLGAIEIDDSSVDVAGAARACIGSNGSEAASVAPNKEEMIAAVSPKMNAGFGNTRGSAENKDAPRLRTWGLCVATVWNRWIWRGSCAHRMNPCPPTTRSQKLDVSAGSL